MSAITSYADLYPLMVPELSGCPENFILQSLKKTLRKFCQDSNAWREQLASINLKEGVLDYALASKWDAEIKEIIEVRIGAEIVDLAGADVVTTTAAGEASLAVHDIASDSGTIYSGDKFILSGGDGTLYTLSANATVTSHAATITFTPVLSQIATAGTELSVVPPKDLGVLIAPAYYTYHAEDTVRLDVAQAAGILSLDSSLEPDEDLIRGLDVKVSLVPHINSDDDQIDYDFLTRWAEAIIGGSIWWLMTMKGRKWSDPQRAPLFMLDYNRGLSRARREMVGGYKVEMEDLSA
jgi:hypothetical protein